MYFKIIGEIEHKETFASGKGIREMSRLQKIYGKGKWRKRKGVADVKLSDVLMLSSRMDQLFVLNYTGMKQRVLVRRNLKLNATLTENVTMATTKSHQLVICVNNEDYPASLEKRKIYEAIPDPAAEKHGQIRVIDESSEDYLYPREYFITVSLPRNIEEAVIKAA